ncbi:MAG TPA: PTS sugar transporter subunit IIC [Eubacteriaceae bacterium]|jgi:PTS system cellobiose-specific IIC component|nr:PTS sugar transporter subunit IIC [Eubacteriaceae bacterium]
MDKQNFRMKIQKFSGKIQSNKFLGSISNGLMLTMSVLIIGSIFTLLDSINITAYQEFLQSTGLKSILSIPPSVTVSLISLYAVATISYSLAGKYNKDGLTAALISMMSFLLLTPMGLMEDGMSTGIGTRWLGAPGFFVAVIIALLVSRLYVLIVDKEIYIKMPKGVPPTVEKSFASIVPGIIIATIMLALRGIFQTTDYGNVHSFIYSILQVPLTNLGGSWWAFLATTLIGSLLWGIGIHGTMIVYSVMAPIWTTLRLENLSAYQAGLELPHLAPGGVFQATYITIGGSGATIGLAIAMLYATSKRYKTLGKLAILPSFLGINEPIMFGFPVVLNPRLLIPLIAVPFINVSLALGLTAVGILPRLAGIGSPLGTPMFINGFIEGGWRVAVFQVILVLISFAIYYPFFKKIDVEAYNEEINAENAKESENVILEN